jgi:hypothetical protein
VDKTLSTLSGNSEGGNGGARAGGDSVEDVIARGAAAAIEAEPGAEPATEAGAGPGGVTFTEPGTKRRRYTKRNSRRPAEPSPEEVQQQEAARELEAFFSPEGIGTVFTTGLDAFYVSCGAPRMADGERDMLAKVFAQWAKYRLPAGASQYQPDILLVATVGMVTLPRIQPIAEKTAPWWRRVGQKITAPFRRAKPGQPVV